MSAAPAASAASVGSPASFDPPSAHAVAHDELEERPKPGPLAKVVSYVGWPIFLGGIGYSLMQFGAFVAPYYHYIEFNDRPWWYHPLYMCVSAEAIWFSRFMVLADDPWDLPKPYKGEEVNLKEVGNQPGASAIDIAIAERNKKLLTVVPGVKRGFVLKVCMGTNFLLTILVAYWVGEKTLLFSGALLIGGLYLLQLALDMGQHWNTSVRFGWMQSFLNFVFNHIPKPILVGIAGGMIMGGFVASSVQEKLVDRLQVVGERVVDMLPKTQAELDEEARAKAAVQASRPECVDAAAKVLKLEAAAAKKGAPNYCGRNGHKAPCNCLK